MHWTEMATLKANGHLFHSATRKNKRDGVIIMNERIMVKVRCGRELLDIWTVSRSRKSPHKFAILRSELQELERCQSRVLMEDCGSFAALRLMAAADGMQILEIRFTWLQQESGNRVSGWTERVRLPYQPFQSFLESHQDLNRAEWRQLSIPEAVTRRFEFHSRENLHAVIQRPILRHKLGKALEKNFQWIGTHTITFYDDMQQYSFFFEERGLYGRGICGGLILHNPEDLRKAQYSVHT